MVAAFKVSRHVVARSSAALRKTAARSSHGHVLADWHRASGEHVRKAINAAAEARREWARWPWEERAAVFLKAAELLATTWRDTLMESRRALREAFSGEPGA
jgi:acyl-CoA reductase-like NAD-dependent aldehyde dehydrogenase